MCEDCRSGRFGCSGGAPPLGKPMPSPSSTTCGTGWASNPRPYPASPHSLRQTAIHSRACDGLGHTWITASWNWTTTQPNAPCGLRAIALVRKNYVFVGSPAGGSAAAVAYTLIETARFNGVDPETRRADTVARIPDCKITKVQDWMPWK